MTATTPTFRFLFRHPAHFLALGFGAGLAPFAPGTFGTLVAIPIAHGLRHVTGDLGYALAVALLFAAGAWASAVTSRHLGVADHGAIVVDEVVAFLAVLFFTGLEPFREIAAFLLFRLFDIVKPFPARLFQDRLPGGCGVVADDLAAGVYANLVLQALIYGFGM